MKSDTRKEIETELQKDKIDGQKVTELLVRGKTEPGHPTDLERRRNGTGRVRVAPGFWSEEEKLQALCVFAATGNSRRTSEITGIPESSIRTWKQEDWWHEQMQRVYAEQDEQLDAKLTKVVDKALDLINDKLAEGDHVYDAKRGVLVKIPVKARDLATVTALSIDKRQLLRGQPTSRVESTSTAKRLDNLMHEFKKFAKAKTIDQKGEQIEQKPAET